MDDQAPIDPVRLASAIVLGSLFLVIPFGLLGLSAGWSYPGAGLLAIRAGIGALSYALPMTALVMPWALRTLRDPALRPVRWASAGLTVGVIGAVVQTLLAVLAFGYGPDLAAAFGAALGIGVASGIIAAMAAWAILRFGPRAGMRR